MKRPEQTRPFGNGRRNRRKGVLTLEAILVLPILIVATLATIQFGVLLVVQQAVSHAATVAAREAGKGADVDTLVCVVNAVLAPHGITIGEGASVVLEDPAADEPVVQRGTLPANPPATPTLNNTEVRVTVSVELSQRPFLNALKSFCIDFTDKRFEISSFVKKETLESSETQSATQSVKTLALPGADCGCS